MEILYKSECQINFEKKKIVISIQICSLDTTCLYKKTSHFIYIVNKYNFTYLLFHGDMFYGPHNKYYTKTTQWRRVPKFEIWTQTAITFSCRPRMV